MPRVPVPVPSQKYMLGTWYGYFHFKIYNGYTGKNTKYPFLNKVHFQHDFFHGHYFFHRHFKFQSYFKSKTDLECLKSVYINSKCY